MKKRIVGRIKKNESTDLIIQVDEYKGEIGLTIREFILRGNYQGFTKSGTRITSENFKDFKHIINNINEKDLEMTEEEKVVAKQLREDYENNITEYQFKNELRVGMEREQEQMSCDCEFCQQEMKKFSDNPEGYLDEKYEVCAVPAPELDQ